MVEVDDVEDWAPSQNEGEVPEKNRSDEGQQPEQNTGPDEGHQREQQGSQVEQPPASQQENRPRTFAENFPVPDNDEPGDPPVPSFFLL